MKKWIRKWLGIQDIEKSIIKTMTNEMTGKFISKISQEAMYYDMQSMIEKTVKDPKIIKEITKEINKFQLNK